MLRAQDAGDDVTTDETDSRVRELQRTVAQLQAALASARTVSCAVGIVMAAQKQTYDQAFEYLSRTSMHLNRKLRDLAERIVETGEIPDPDVTRGPSS